MKALRCRLKKGNGYNSGLVAYDDSLSWFYYEPTNIEVGLLFLINRNDVDKVCDIIGQDAKVTYDWLCALLEIAFYEKHHSDFIHNYVEKCVFATGEN